MKKFLNIIILSILTLAAQAQIFESVKWKINLEDTGTPDKAIVFTATCEPGWHLYDMNLPEGGPVCAKQQSQRPSDGGFFYCGN